MWKRVGFGLVLLLLVAGATMIAASSYVRHRTNIQAAISNKQLQDATAVPVAPAPSETTAEIMVQRGDTWSDLLDELEVPDDSAQMITAAAGRVFSFRQLQPGSKLTAIRSNDGTLKSISFSIAFDRQLRITPTGDDFAAEVIEVPSTTRTIGIAGQVEGSLFQSVVDAGGAPDLAMRLAEIFAWDLDFYTDPRPGDTFKLVLEKKTYENGAPATYGKIFAAEYDNSGRKFTAVLFHDENGKPAYYDANGNSLQKAFLRSPLKFAARVSSHFSRSRFHPVLKIFRPHLGTDYAAPNGTPVQAIGQGRVVFSGFQGGGGNVVRVRHSRGFETYYMHLSKRLVHTGQKVSQGQRIGLVGATGLATGPHLDFRLRRNGAFVNFERMKLPPDSPVRRRDLASFSAERDRWFPVMVALSPENGETEVAPAIASTVQLVGTPVTQPPARQGTVAGR